MMGSWGSGREAWLTKQRAEADRRRAEYEAAIPHVVEITMPLRRQLSEWIEAQTPKGMKYHRQIAKPEFQAWLDMTIGDHRWRWAQRPATDDDPVEEAYLRMVNHAQRMGRHDVPERRVYGVAFEHANDALHFKMRWL